jgi:hypothetical protein
MVEEAAAKLEVVVGSRPFVTLMASGLDIFVTFVVASFVTALSFCPSGSI